jgi:hypothetical protein
VTHATIAPDLRENLIPIHSGERDIEQHEIGKGAREALECIRTILVFDDLIAIAKNGAEQEPVVGVVLDDGDSWFGHFGER